MEMALSAEPITIEVAREIARNTSCAAEPTNIIQLQGGTTDVYRIDFADGTAPQVLKVYADEPDWFMKKEAMIAGWIGDRIGVPVPQWLVLDDTRRLLSRRYAVMTFLPGAMARSLIGTSDAHDVYRQMGAALRRTHEIPMSAYGYIGTDGIAQPKHSNSEYMSSAIEGALRRFQDAGGGSELTRRLRSSVDERSDVFACNVSPVLCHCDFHQGNVLAARDERGQLKLTGLIDFTNASAADPLLDLASALFFCTHEDAQSREPLLAGYGKIEHPDPESALWLYTLHHRVTMWAHLKRLGIDAVGISRDLSAMCA
jgi:aminoglycoside phosphotransferase (APT) family kinase protein